jgi:uncharacterized protein (DUF1697 family)
MGFTDVLTYIQSGNVLFTSASEDITDLTNKIEDVLSSDFKYKAKIVLVTQKQLTAVIKKAPKDFGADQEKYRYDVLFLKKPLTSASAIKEIKLREGVDKVHAGKDVLYFSRLIEKAGQSYLNKIISLPIYKSMTIRNWNTTTRLLLLMNK